MNETADRKKMTNVYLLEILKRYTDAAPNAEGNPSRTLTQSQIAKILERDYGITMQRKAISKGLFDLAESQDFCHIIEFDTAPRKAGKNPDPTEARTNFRYYHEFDSAQIRFLMEAVLFSKSIPDFECQTLLEKIGKLLPTDAENRIGRHSNKLKHLAVDKVTNSQILNSIDIIEEAIEKDRQVGFIVNRYGKDKKLHPKTGPDGKPLVRVVNPYSIVANNGNYYLVCNYDEYNFAQNIRIDKITDVNMLDAPRKAKKKVRGSRELPETVAEQLYMMEGTAVPVSFRVDDNDSIIDELVDWFGKSIRFENTENNTVTCTVKANPKAIKRFALQYADSIEVLAPAELRDEVANTLLAVSRKYNAIAEPQTEADNIALITKWEKHIKNAEIGVFDVQELAGLVKTTYYTFLPYFGCELPNAQAYLYKALQTVQHDCRSGIHSHLNLISLVLRALNEKVQHTCYGKYKNAAESDSILRISTRTEDGQHNRIEIDINRFEEDYITLLQYTDEQAVKSRAAMEEMCQRLHEQHRRKVQERHAKTGTENDKYPHQKEDENA